MAGWFESAPLTLDAVVVAAKVRFLLYGIFRSISTLVFQFQFEHLAALVRYYRRLCSQQKTLLERVAKDRSDSKNLRL